jgi:hypothetical protein
MVEEFHERGYGLCIKTDEPQNFENSLEKNTLQIGRTLLEAGKMYDLDNFFSKKIKYCGMRNGYMVFYLGTTKNLFDSLSYYELIFYSTPTRFFCHYTTQGGRDHNFINGFWDYEPEAKKGRKSGKRIATT